MLFQFLIVRLKFNGSLNNIKPIKFQFLIVRLKYLVELARIEDEKVSIPYSTIKMNRRYTKMESGNGFQFLIVRLKFCFSLLAQVG